MRTTHIDTFWIRSAVRVRVYYHLDAPSILALEEVNIDLHWDTAWNVERGQFSRQFGDKGLNMEVLARKAQQGPMAEFEIVVTPP